MRDSRWCFCDLSIALPFIFSRAKVHKRALLLPLVSLITSSVTGEELGIHVLEDN